MDGHLYSWDPEGVPETQLLSEAPKGSRFVSMNQVSVNLNEKDGTQSGYTTIALGSQNGLVVVLNPAPSNAKDSVSVVGHLNEAPAVEFVDGEGDIFSTPAPALPFDFTAFHVGDAHRPTYLNQYWTQMKQLNKTEFHAKNVGDFISAAAFGDNNQTVVLVDSGGLLQIRNLSGQKTFAELSLRDSATPVLEGEFQGGGELVVMSSNIRYQNQFDALDLGNKVPGVKKAEIENAQQEFLRDPVGFFTRLRALEEELNGKPLKNNIPSMVLYRDRTTGRYFVANFMSREVTLVKEGQVAVP
ncbi:MAG: hypothetical protein R3A80_05230 [Bdellovibrionota bacterium]